MNYKYILTAILVMSVFSGTASAWLTGYDHRMAITVNNGGASELNYYQFNFTNDTNVLVAAGNMQASGADCRITDASDNLLPFWNETPFNATGTKIWVNATALAVGNNTFYMYYGNAGSGDVSDIATTFMFGDDFTGNPDSIDPATGNFGDWSANRASYIVGDTAYVTERNGLHAVNISDPANPVLRGFVGLGTGSIDDGSLDVNVIGNYAFVSVRCLDKLSVVDISDPDNLVEVGNVTDSTYLNDNHGIYALGDYVYCCAFTHYELGYLTIVNVSNKMNPTIEGYVNHTALKGPHDVYVEGNYAYVSSHRSGFSANNGTFTIVDVSTKSSPSVVSYIDSADLYGAADVQKSGNYCYVGGINNSSNIHFANSIDVSDTNNPFIADTLPNCNMYTEAIYDNYLYGAAGILYVLNISDPTSLSLVKTYAPTPSGDGAQHIFLTADGAYIVIPCWVQSPATDGYYIINRTDLLAYTTTDVDTDKWDTANATGTWTILNNVLRSSGDGKSLLTSKYAVPSGYVFEMKVNKTNDRNIYGYPKYVASTNAIQGILNRPSASRAFYVSVDGNETTSILDNVTWSLNTWYNFYISDESGTYKFITEKLDGSDSYTINAVDSVNFTGHLAIAAYDGEGYFDDIRVRQYASPQPAATLGAEEIGGDGCGAYNITLPLGWSIIGWTNPTASTAHSMGTLIGGNCQYVTERNSTTGLYVTHVMSNPTDDNFAIERGWGYFVKTTAETLWERDS